MFGSKPLTPLQLGLYEVERFWRCCRMRGLGSVKPRHGRHLPFSG